ncbi:hypothetical protein PHYPSEUDO_004649 [Phytophthora pseudosyringae]|uniref:Uncharacterized protein n=1 Tax=Phytophthora pseudosyringae TaxID=221518 RepID=A0A8T1VR80_9STRA|nr:hypothetical protein PHYPSEUDO_004649 [Phytophthora pseudosyringae]
MEELYERILALVESQELHRSSNGVLHEEYAALVEAVNDVAATFAKVEEVREAVNQLEQGKPSTGRSASLLDVMDSTMQLQQELHNTLKKVAAGMKVEDVPVKRKRSEEQVKKEKEQESSASSDSSASSSSEEEVQTKKHKRQEKGKTSNGSKKQSADLSLAHDALSTITKVKTANRRIEAEMKDKWAEAIFDAKRILKHQSACDAHTTDNAATEVTARALETAIVVFQKLDWTAEHAKEVRSVIAALSDACSKNAVLRIFFHRARAQLESLEMSIPASLVNAAGGSTITKPAATGSSLEDLLRTYDNLSRSMHTQPPRVKPKRIVEALSAMQQVMADDFMCAHAENSYELIQKSLGELDGVMVCQDTPMGTQTDGLPQQTSNKYAIHQLPAQGKVKNNHTASVG